MGTQQVTLTYTFNKFSYTASPYEIDARLKLSISHLSNTEDTRGKSRTEDIRDKTVTAMSRHSTWTQQQFYFSAESSATKSKPCVTFRRLINKVYTDVWPTRDIPTGLHRQNKGRHSRYKLAFHKLYMTSISALAESTSVKLPAHHGIIGDSTLMDAVGWVWDGGPEHSPGIYSRGSIL